MIKLEDINLGTIEIDGVNSDDYPKFVDAYISHAERKDGKELTDAELDQLTEDNYELVNELAHDSFR